MAREMARRETSQPARAGQQSQVRDVVSLRDTISGLFDDFFQGRPMMASFFRGTGATEGFMPPVDIVDKPEEMLIYAALPGIHKNDCNVEVADHTLVLSGECRCEEGRGEESENYLRKEIPEGKFYRAFSLPVEIKQDQVKANYEDGILEIHLPKAAEAQPKKVTIQ